MTTHLLLFVAFITVVCLSWHSIEAITINVLPQNTTLSNTTCPAGYSGLCTNDVAIALNISSNGDIVIAYGSYYYLNATNSHGFWSDSIYLSIENSIVFTSNGSTLIEFGGCNPEITTVGISINSDNVNITKLNFTSLCPLRTLLYVSYNGTDSQGTYKRDKLSWTLTPSVTFVNGVNKTTFLAKRANGEIVARNPIPIDQPCATCFCGCGKTTSPEYVRYNVTILNCSFTANATAGIISTGSWYGLSFFAVQNNVIEQLYSQDYQHISINSTYVADSIFTFNHYGKCVYPRVYIIGCDDTEYIPYYIDDALTLSAPLVDQTGTPYVSLFDAVGAGAANISLRGELYMEESVVVSTIMFHLTAAGDHACCATINVPSGMNPAIMATYPTVFVEGVTFSMGAGSGGILFRNGAAQNVNDLNILSYPEIGVNVTAYSLLSNATAASLLTIYRPSYLPRYPFTTILSDVQFVSTSTNDTSKNFEYAVLIFPMNAAIFPKLVIQNSLIDGGNYGVINKHPSTSLVGNLIKCVNSIVANDTGTYSSNIIIVNDFGQPDALFANTSYVTLNQFFLLSNTCNPVYPSYIAPISQGNQYIYQNASDYTLYATYTDSAKLGLSGIDEVQIQITHLSSCNYVGRGVFIPNTTASPFTTRNSVPSYYSLYSSFSIDEHRVVMTRYKKDLGDLDCNGIVMYSGYSNGGTPLWSIGGVYGTDGISSRDIRICGSINYTTEATSHNAAYQMSYGPAIVYVCPTYNYTDSNHTTTLEDAVFISEPGTIIKMCNGSHQVESCVTVNKAVDITNDGLGGTPTISCSINTTCCCIVDVTPSGGGTTITYVTFSQTTMYDGDDNCCYPSAIQSGTDGTGESAPGSYTGGCTYGITIMNSNFVGFKNAMRLGCVANASVYLNTIQNSVGGIIASTTGFPSLLSGTIWQDFANGDDLAYNTYFLIINNTFSNTIVGISNQDLQGSAPTTTCRDNAIGYYRNGLWAPWIIQYNMFNGVNVATSIRGVSSFSQFPITIDSNTITNATSTLDYVPPPFDSNVPVSFVIESDGVYMTLNNIAKHDVVILSSSIIVVSNVIQDSNINITNDNSYFMFQEGSPLNDWDAFIFESNNMCVGNLSSMIYISLLSPNMQGIGFNQIVVESNKMPSLDRLNYVTNNLGVPQNVNVTGTINCRGTSIQPNTKNGQYLLPDLTGYETTVFGTCGIGTLPAGNGLSCKSCVGVSLGFEVTANVAEAYCIVFAGGAPATTTTTTTSKTTTTTGSHEQLASISVLSWVIPLAIVGFAVVVVFIVALCSAWSYVHVSNSNARKRL